MSVAAPKMSPLTSDCLHGLEQPVEGNSWCQSTRAVRTLAAKLVAGLGPSEQKVPPPHTAECDIKSTYPHKRRPPVNHPHCQQHGRRAPCATQGHFGLATLLLLISLCLVGLASPCATSETQYSERSTATHANDFGSRLRTALSRTAEGPSHQNVERHPMSPSLAQFSNLNEDLVFEDSLDVQSTHFNTSDQDVSATVLMPDGEAAGPFGRHSHLQNTAQWGPAETGAHPSGTREKAARQSAGIHRLDLHSSQAPLHKTQFTQEVSNHLTVETPSDLAPRGPPSLMPNRDTLPKRVDLARIEMPSDFADNSIAREAPHNDSSLEHQSMTGDHILRPFFRKDRKHRELQKQTHHPTNKPTRAKAQPREQPEWQVPVIELKRLNDHSRHEDNFKRLPLMGNEEGFVLTRPNSSLQSRETPPVPSWVPKPKPKPELKRRFGDLPSEPSPNLGPSSEPHPQGPALNGHDPFRMGYLMDDISINDLDLDDGGPSRLGPPNHRKNFAGRKPIVSKPPTAPFEQALPNRQGPQGEPISQIMPLFFDKFLSEFGNHNVPISPEGFALPPNQAKFGPFEQPRANIPPPINQLDGGELGDLDAPNHVERRLTNGNLPNNKGKPELGPFSNEIAPPTEFDNEFGPWPKIFRFTDGRINLHDFEREKKRSRIKFSQKLSKSQALFNIKRESFLILHGGTFSQ